MVPSRRWAPAVEWNARLAIPCGLADAWSNEPSCERTEQWLALIWIIQPRGRPPGRDANGVVPHGQIGVGECHQRQAFRGTVRIGWYPTAARATLAPEFQDVAQRTAGRGGNVSLYRRCRAHPDQELRQPGLSAEPLDQFSGRGYFGHVGEGARRHPGDCALEQYSG